MLGVFRGPITGPKFFAIFASFFVVIIAVNIYMARAAILTFPGLEVKNSYVASQNFDRERAAQLALGWEVHATVHQGQLVVKITDAAGQPVEAATLTGTFGRPTTVRDDQTPAFVFDGVAFSAPVTAGPGQWNFRMEAVAQDGTPFHQRLVVHVEE